MSTRRKPKPKDNVVRMPIKSVHHMRRQPETSTCHLLWDMLDLAKWGEIEGVIPIARRRDGRCFAAGADCHDGRTATLLRELWRLADLEAARWGSGAWPSLS